jgi:hypothetical protein
MRRHPVLYGSLVMVAVGLFVACGDDPSPVKPSPVSASEFTGIEVIGPDSLGAGQSAQFVANIRQADGTTKSATSMPNLRWSSSNTSLMFVSSSGVVTSPDPSYDPPYGEAVITAELTNQPGVQGTRKVVIRPKAMVTAALDVGPQATPGQYVFALKFTESAGVSATVTDLWLHFDSGWSGQCGWTAADLGQPRLPANGTLALGPLTCLYDSYGGDIYLDVDISLRDDNGYVTRTYLHAVVR